jgi:MFS family permease
MTRARLSLALLLAINLFNYIDRYVLAAVESRIARDLLPNDPNALAKMGSLATAFIVSYMLAAPIFGWLADRMSRWLLVGIGVAVWSLASGGSGLASTFSILLITRMFVGIGEAGYGPAAPTIISDLFPVERRGQVLSWFYMAIPVGSAIGYMWGGKLESWLNWRWAFYTVVPPGIVLAALCFMFSDPRLSVAPVEKRKQKAASFHDYLSLLRNRSYMLDCAGMTAMTFAIGGVAFWMPRYTCEYRHAGTLDRVNTIFGAIMVVGGLTGTLIGGMVGDKLRSRFPGSYFLVSGVAILLSAPFVVLMLYTPFPAAWVVIFIAVFLLFFNTGPSNTILANVTAPSIRATAFAVNILIIHALGDAVSPPLLGAISSGYGWNAMFMLIAAVMACAGVIWLFGAPHLVGDTAAASAEVDASSDNLPAAARD